MKKRKSKRYLILGTSHQGMSVEVLRIIRNIASYYNAIPVHVGPLATNDEIRMYQRRLEKLVTWEKQEREKIELLSENTQNELDILYAEIETANQELKELSYEDKEFAKIDKQIAVMEDKIEKLVEKENLCHERMIGKKERYVKEIKDLLDAQALRIKTLQKILPGIHFVCNSSLMIGDKNDRNIPDNKYHNKNWVINSNISITATPANGDKVSGSPVTKRTFRMLQKSKMSHIVPHMTPQTKTFPRPGLNHAYNFITTGSLQFMEFPERITDTYKAVAAPSVILLTVDEKIDEFHPERIRIKKIGDSLKALHDGLLFSNKSVKELKNTDKAVFITDSHMPYTHLGVIASMRALNKLHQPSVFIDGGDTGDFESVSRHTEAHPGLREKLRLNNDLDGVKKLLHAYANKEEFDFIKERVLLDSNHHEWLTSFVDKNPALKGILDWKTLSKTKYSEWNLFIRDGGADKYYKFGDLCMKHGDKETTVSGFEIYNNYLAGHSHTYDEFCDGIKIGPACSLGPKYLQNSANSWQNNICSITKSNNVTCKHPKIVLHSEDKMLSRFCYRGQIYEVKYYKF